MQVLREFESHRFRHLVAPALTPSRSHIPVRPFVAATAPSALAFSYWSQNLAAARRLPRLGPGCSPAHFRLFATICADFCRTAC